ncbi:unnamed protein product, partial [Coregonus sp. 'balchen']
MTKERDQLTNKSDQLKTSFNAMTKERDQFQGAENTGPGRRVYRLVAVSFGLLCIVQVTLNVSLRLFFSNSAQMHWLQISYNNLTEEAEHLRTLFNVTLKERNQLQTSFTAVTNERDQAQTKMSRQGWMYFSFRWYYISTETKSWEESRKDCKGRGVDLVIINSKEEQVRVKEEKEKGETSVVLLMPEYIHGFKKMRYWIGLADIEIESTVTWVDGTPLTI